VIAGDVLEHLPDPWTVLRRAAALLPAGATAIVSLPNVRYWETFWVLARHNTWPRRPDGIFDATHLRWFTLRDAWALLDQAGLDTVAVERQMRLRGRGTRWDGAVSRLVRLPGRGLLTFQHILVDARGSRPTAARRDRSADTARAIRSQRRTNHGAPTAWRPLAIHSRILE
jgi:Methyltransferase domain